MARATGLKKSSNKMKRIGHWHKIRQFLLKEKRNFSAKEHFCELQIQGTSAKRPFPVGPWCSHPGFKLTTRRLPLASNGQGTQISADHAH